MAIKHILVTGARGLLGRELLAYLQAKGYQVSGTSSADLDLLATQEAITETIQRIAPEVIVHCAAYTNVDGAEKQPELAMAINKEGTRKLALAAKEAGSIFAYISTDYVFDGAKNALYTVQDRPRPINTYGLSKYYGELQVTELLDTYYIVRTSWLYGIYGKNFVQFVLESARQGREVSIIQDQYGSPTWSGTLCHLIEQIVTSGSYGTYHACDRGRVSRYEQALAICRRAGLSEQNIRPVPSQEFPQAATRPVCTAMDPSPLASPTWETALDAFMEQYLHHAALL
ncbi:MAG: dTDP-4-dehydrorhamnose reductase [Candidatus Melainabacteria bacterium]|nr:dTDP-4-dehydrorhamnose reductase [Candidatus Melainabacteria bacterium]